MFRKIDEWGGVEVYSCLSSDTKQTGVQQGSYCIETDTQDLYRLYGSWTRIESGGAAHVAVTNLACHEVITENVFSGTTAGSRVKEGGLEGCSYFQFQVVGAETGGSPETVEFSVSLDGVNFVDIPVVNVATGAAIAAGTEIDADGIYRYGNEPTSTSLRDAPVGLGVKAIKVTKTTSTNDDQLDVIMRAT